MSIRPFPAASLLSQATPSAAVSPVPVTVKGTPGPDIIHGSDLADELSGDAGDDQLFGYGGNDILYGGMGNDELWGGDGDDELWDNMGIDKLYGGNGNDRLMGASGSWQWPSPVSEMPYLLLDGGAGNDMLNGANLYNFMGGAGDDTLSINISGNAPTHSFVDGGDGDDRLQLYFHFRAQGELTVTGGAGIDTYGLYTADLMQQTQVRLRITDFAAGANGDRFDLFLLVPPQQNGNPFTSGFLRLVESGGNTLFQVKLNTAEPSYQTLLELTGVRPSQLTGNNFVGGISPTGNLVALTLVGTPQDDTLSGGEVNDILSGEGGNDVLHGLGGDDRLDGGSGDDQLHGGAGNDILQGGDGDDRLRDFDGGSNELFGGAGNDHLEVQGPGTNLLDGGPGDDQLFGPNGNFIGPVGQYTLRGGEGNDYLFAYKGAILEGGDGNDYLSSGNGGVRLDGGNGNDILSGHDNATDFLIGGAGIDHARYVKNSTDYTMTRTAGGFNVAYTDGTSSSTDYLDGIERLQFKNTSIALDIDGFAGQAYRIYRAAFDRAPDLVGMGFWLSRLDRGTSLTEIAGGFAASKEFAELYGSAPSNADLVTRMYKNVLHRDADPSGYAFWLDALDQGKADLPTVLAAISESQENRDAVATLIATGIPYTVYGG